MTGVDGANAPVSVRVAVRASAEAAIWKQSIYWYDKRKFYFAGGFISFLLISPYSYSSYSLIFFTLIFMFLNIRRQNNSQFQNGFVFQCVLSWEKQFKLSSSLTEEALLQ